MTKDIHILYGFDNSKIKNNIENILRKKEFSIESSEKTTLRDIETYMEEHSDCKYTILLENNGTEYISPDAVVNISRIHQMNIVYITMENNKGTPYMRDLYAAGVFNALFQKSDRGITSDELADALINGKTKEMAREYYELPDNIDEIIGMSDDIAKFNSDETQNPESLSPAPDNEASIFDLPIDNLTDNVDDASTKPAINKNEMGFFYMQPKKQDEHSENTSLKKKDDNSVSIQNKLPFIASLIGLSTVAILCFGFILIQILSYQSKVELAKQQQQEEESLMENNAIVEAPSMEQPNEYDYNEQNDNQNIQVIEQELPSSSSSYSSSSYNESVIEEVENNSDGYSVDNINQSSDVTINNSSNSSEGEVTILENTSAPTSDSERNKQENLISDESQRIQSKPSLFHYDTADILQGTSQIGINVINIINGNNFKCTVTKADGKGINIQSGNASSLNINVRKMYYVSSAINNSITFTESN